MQSPSHSDSDHLFILTLYKLMSLKQPEQGLLSIKGLIFTLGLIAASTSVAVLYSTLIRPLAEQSRLAQHYDLSHSKIGQIALILKDYEQQVCLTLLVWALMILAYKFSLLRIENQSIEKLGFLENAPHSPGSQLASCQLITRATAHRLSQEMNISLPLQTREQQLLPYVLLRGLERYHLTGSVQETTETIMGRLQIAAEQQESELSMLRYLAWAIPSIGFIGTVRGIGVALMRADEALTGDLSGVTGALGVAFNSTLVALFISILLMLLIHLLQSGQESLILRLQTICREKFLDKLMDHPEGSAQDSPCADASTTDE
jgi:biopolymer transport protein ExbB/TolQ